MDIELKWWNAKKESRHKEKTVGNAFRAQEGKISLMESYRRTALENGTALERGETG